MWPAETEVMDFPALPSGWQHEKLSDISLETRPRYSLIADEDVKKSNKQMYTRKFPMRKAK